MRLGVIWIDIGVDLTACRASASVLLIVDTEVATLDFAKKLATASNEFAVWSDFLQSGDC